MSHLPDPKEHVLPKDGDSTVDEPTAPLPRAVPLDWPAFLARDLGPVDFLAGRLLVRGHHGSLVAPGKEGKSLFAQEWAWRIAAGLPFLDDGAHAPLRVLYVDQENSEDEIQERLLSFGATAETLANLTYLSFPAFRPLTSADGGADLLAAVEEYRPAVVFFDTISRMIVGKENESDPWLALYRHALMPLKRRGISSIRLDHMGKDESRGARGNSAKTQDVDAVWELLATDRGSTLLKLTRTFTRSGKGVDELLIRRHGELIGDRWKPGATCHTLAGDDERPPVTPDERTQLAPSTRRVLGILGINAPIAMTTKDIGDALAGQDQGPLKERTIQNALKILCDAGRVEEMERFRGNASGWVLRAEAGDAS